MSHHRTAPVHYRSVAELEAVVRGFEACTTAAAEFSHGAHLTVALWYVAHAPLQVAADRMRQSLARFIAHHGVEPQKYNETITLFWLKLVAHFHAHAGAGRTLADVANELLARFGDAQLLFRHYSRALIQMPEAKAAWVAPDLQPLGFE